MNKKAFTLVELIVVITILAVLGTVAFVSFQDYVGNSRDSKRTTDIKNIEKALELSKLQTGVYPNPGASTNITYSGATVWKQGEFNNDVVRVVENFKEAPKDPLVDSFYAYSVTKNRGEYQLGGVLEDIDYGTSANGKLAGAYVKGNYNGKTVKVSTGSTTYVLAAPSILTSDLNETDLLKITQAQKLVYKGHKNLPASYTGTTYNVNGGFEFIPKSGTIVAYEGDLATVDSTTLVDNLQKIYTGTTVVSEPDIVSIFDKDKELTAKIILGKKITGSANNNSTNTGGGNALTGWRALDPNCKIDDITIGSQTWAGCNSTLGNGFEYGQTDANIGTSNYSGIVKTCNDYEGNNTATCTQGDITMASNTKANTWFSGANKNGDREFDTIWGKLYVWANSDSACHTGYHVPSDAEWEILETTLNKGTNCRNATDGFLCYGLGWQNHTTTHSFTSIAEKLKLPLAGFRNIDKTGFYSRGDRIRLWSSTPSASSAYSRNFYWAKSTVYRTTRSQDYGFSVRCIKD